jgi:hypothetical protein
VVFFPFLARRKKENVSWIPGPIAFTLGSGAAAHPEVVSGVGISRPVLKIIPFSSPPRAIYFQSVAAYG